MTTCPASGSRRNSSTCWAAEAGTKVRWQTFWRPTFSTIRQVGAPEEALLRDWTTRLRAVFESDSEKDRCATVNALLEQGVKRVFLTVHDGLGPHLHFAETSDSLVERVRALTAGGLAIFITEAAGGRLGTCARDGCPKVFADTSRGGRRAYCSARCGNAEAVMRYRERGHYAGRP
ncbi:CGNR zinc finger domain-containing protein [Pseudarthrobacter sp. LMD1-1-1.1]